MEKGVALGVDTIFCPTLNFDRSFSLKMKDVMILLVGPNFFCCSSIFM